MEPIHAIEYELTSELATMVQRRLAPWELRRSWRRDLPLLTGAAAFAILIIALGLANWILPGVAGGLIALLALFVLGAVFRRWAIARGAGGTALLALYSGGDRRVRVEFLPERVRMETEFFRGEGAWTELDEVLIFPGFWFLHLSNGGQILLPEMSMSPGLESFIRTKASEVMASVRTCGG